jgi:hypothetical protein
MWHMVYQSTEAAFGAFPADARRAQRLDLSAFDAYVNLATETDDRPGDPL